MEIHNRCKSYQIIDSEGGVICHFVNLKAASVVMRYLMGVPQDADETALAQACIEAHDEEERRKDAERQKKKKEAGQKAKARKEARAAQKEGAAQ